MNYQSWLCNAHLGSEIAHTTPRTQPESLPFIVSGRKMSSDRVKIKIHGMMCLNWSFRVEWLGLAELMHLSASKTDYVDFHDIHRVLWIIRGGHWQSWSRGIFIASSSKLISLHCFFLPTFKFFSWGFVSLKMAFVPLFLCVFLAVRLLGIAFFPITT